MAKNDSQMLNRELSWLEFNSRVLEEAFDATVPLLERLKFLAISSSNLDEFFMVRVGGLQQLLEEGRSAFDPNGLTTEQQLAEIRRRTERLVADQYQCLMKELDPELAVAGIQRLHIESLNPEQLAHVERIFTHDLYPLISPIAVKMLATFPLLPGLRLNLLVRLEPDKESPQTPRFAVLHLPRTLARFIAVPDPAKYTCIPVEEMVAAFVARFFPGETVVECMPFRITRNADLSVREDQAGDLLGHMREVLDARKRSNCVRLETDERISDAALAFLRQALRITFEQIYKVPGPIDLSAFWALVKLPGFDKFKDKAWPPQASPGVPPDATMFDIIARKDVLLFHPFQSFEPVVRFIEQAADDPDVLAIKQILYRTNENSRIVAALARAAGRGKLVTALVELKARFDEARNIEWAEALEHAGVQVIYGLKRLKVHAKVCIVVRRESTGIRRYVHFGTGNYNEVTARIYSDVGLMTCDEDLAADATAFFNAITGYSQPIQYRKIEAAPHGLRAKLIEMIESETERSKQGQKAHIIAKLNALVHRDVIEALYRASQAGVKIDLNIRGVCCLRPGVAGLSENITVISILDRFLEHSRIVYFLHGGEERVFISSADWMPRNLDRRVELLVPVEDSECRSSLISILKTCLKDTVKARRLLPDGSYERVKPARRGKPLRSQEIFYRQACELAQQAQKNRYMMFEPQLPAKTTRK
ncbi:MAG: polyphosphate kinase 1 [Verrucomicrobia bacterium]|nr:polyphosphate kinase 1 [Verrucomicrobiota bacterium]